MSNEGAVLAPRAAQGRYSLTREPPPGDLTDLIECFWIVQWDLRGEPPFSQATLPYPCVNIVIGTHQPGVHGPVSSRFVAELDSLGWVIGAKFRPAGFRAICSIPAIDLVDRGISLEEVFGAEGAALEQAVWSAPTDPERKNLMEGFVRDRAMAKGTAAGAPLLSEEGREVNRVVLVAQTDTTLVRVAQLAERAGRTVRALERMFRTHLGVSPKAVLRRFRVQEAALRLADGGDVDFAALATALGYFDQAHFTRDFKAQVGTTPAHYAKLCSQATAPTTSG